MHSRPVWGGGLIGIGHEFDCLSYGGLIAGWRMKRSGDKADYLRVRAFGLQVVWVGVGSVEAVFAILLFFLFEALFLFFAFFAAVGH